MIALLLLLFAQDLSTLSAQGAAAMREKRWDDAIRIYQGAASRDPGTPEWKLNLGLALAYANRHDEAAAALVSFLKVRPAPGPAHFVSGLSLLKLKRPCDAIPLLEAARKWKASADVLVELGDAYQGCERWDQAAPVYEQAARLNPSDKRIPRQLARCWWMARRYDKARPVYAAMEATYGGEVEFLFEFGDTLARAEGGEAGLARLQKAAVLDPAFVPARAALGRVLVDLGRAAEAVPHLEAAAPRDPAALLPLSRAYRALGRGEDAARAESEFKKRMGGSR